MVAALMLESQRNSAMTACCSVESDVLIIMFLAGACR
jgi:hypothetical protein